MDSITTKELRRWIAGKWHVVRAIWLLWMLKIIHAEFWRMPSVETRRARELGVHQVALSQINMLVLEFCNIRIRGRIASMERSEEEMVKHPKLKLLSLSF